VLAAIELQREFETSSALQSQTAMLQGQLAAMQQQMQIDALRQQLQMDALRHAQDQAAKRQPQEAKPKPPAAAVPANPKPPAAPPAALTPEERAANKYKLAMRLADEGKADDAAEYCTQICENYPDTTYAERAKDFLAKRGKR
jgi:TolA-binding protein